MNAIAYGTTNQDDLETVMQSMTDMGETDIELQNEDVTGRDFGNKGNLSINGVKFYDANGNGVQDQDEPGLPGQEVKLVESGKEIATVTTGQDGSYTFSNLVPGTYEVDDPIVVTVTTTIKTVVNVVYKTPEQNISDAQINSQIAAFNKDYRATNPDRNQTPTPWLWEKVVAKAKAVRPLISSGIRRARRASVAKVVTTAWVGRSSTVTELERRLAT